MSFPYSNHFLLHRYPSIRLVVFQKHSILRHKNTQNRFCLDDKEGYTWDEVRRVPKADAHDYAVGDVVARRDRGYAWGTGFVTSINPLKVTATDDPNGEGYSWEEVRRVPKAANEFTVVGMGI